MCSLAQFCKSRRGHSWSRYILQYHFKKKFFCTYEPFQVRRHTLTFCTLVFSATLEFCVRHTCRPTAMTSASRKTWLMRGYTPPTTPAKAFSSFFLLNHRPPKNPLKVCIHSKQLSSALPAFSKYITH